MALKRDLNRDFDAAVEAVDGMPGTAFESREQVVDVVSAVLTAIHYGELIYFASQHRETC